MKNISSGQIFWIILALGGVLVTTCYVLLQAPGTVATSGSPVTLSDADKVYIDQMTEQAKWLESLAYASLVGVIVLQGKNPQSNLSRIAATGASLLIISLYAGFLGRDVILVSLTKGAPLLYSTLGTMPYVTQFWALIVALALLAKDILWAKKQVVLAAPLIALLVLCAPAKMHGQPRHARQTVGDPVPGCTVSWAKSRLSTTPSADNQKLMTDFLALVATRSKVPAQKAKTCEFAFSTLDQVRNVSQTMTGSDDLSSMLDVVQSTKDELDSNAAAPGSFCATLVTKLEIWRSQTGSISIETKKTGVTVNINHKYVGMANLLYIDVPGNYTVQVMWGGAVILEKTVTVSANAQSVVSVP